jgi:hypothetical protein
MKQKIIAAKVSRDNAARSRAAFFWLKIPEIFRVFESQRNGAFFNS